MNWEAYSTTWLRIICGLALGLPAYTHACALPADLTLSQLHPAARVYPAMTNASEEAEAFLKIPRSDAARAIFTTAGFEIVGGSGMVDNNTQACANFRFDVNKELELFGGKPRSVAATASPASAAAIDVDQLYSVTLVKQSGVTFAAAPGKPTPAEGSFAGLLRVASSRATTIRVASTEAAWFDVLSSGKLLGPQRHTGNGNCRLLRKVVEFTVTPGQPLTIQVSGSKEKGIKLAVTTV